MVHLVDCSIEWRNELPDIQPRPECMKVLPDSLVFNKAHLISRAACCWTTVNFRCLSFPSPSRHLAHPLSFFFFALAKVYNISARGITVIYSNITVSNCRMLRDGQRGTGIVNNSDSNSKFWTRTGSLFPRVIMRKTVGQTKRKLLIRRCPITCEFLSYNLVVEAARQQLRT